MRWIFIPGCSGIEEEWTGRASQGHPPTAVQEIRTMTEANLQSSTAVSQPSKEIVEFDPRTAESITARMATAVAEATGRSVTEISPLGEWVDCDAIEQLFASQNPSHELSLSFEFEECEVFVSNIGRIVVTPNSEYESA